MITIPSQTLEKNTKERQIVEINEKLLCLLSERQQDKYYDIEGNYSTLGVTKLLLLREILCDDNCELMSFYDTVKEKIRLKVLGL